MDEHTNTGRRMGAAMLAVFTLELVSNFWLQDRLFAGGGFMVNAAAHASDIGLIIVVGVLAAVPSVWVAAMSLGLFEAADSTLARTYFALAACVLAVSVVELSTFLAMRNLSEVYLAAGHDAGGQFDGARAVVRGLRNGIHFTGKLLGGASVLAFFLLLFRSRSLPRLIAGLGMASAPLQMIGVALPLFGYEVIYPLLAPLGLAYLATLGWLLAKGLSAGRPIERRGTERVREPNEA